MRLIDLTRTLDPSIRDELPAPMAGAAAVLTPRITYSAPDGTGRDELCAAMGCTIDDLPDGEGWGSEWMTELGSHMGTHVDAPLHYGTTCEGKPARTITDIALDELYCPGFVLDVRVEPDGRAIATERLRDAVDALGRPIPSGAALLLRTGQERFDHTDARFFNYPGMSREGTLFLASLGAKVLGTDALGWDRPFHVMRAAFARTGDCAEIWDGHFAGRDREVFIVQQLTNLAALPAADFHVGFFPIKLARASAAPARVVAFVDHRDAPSD
jgi:kynurenine formamidase